MALPMARTAPRTTALDGGKHSERMFYTLRPGKNVGCHSATRSRNWAAKSRLTP
jgi:hypothetical protein